MESHGSFHSWAARTVYPAHTVRLEGSTCAARRCKAMLWNSCWLKIQMHRMGNPKTWTLGVLGLSQAIQCYSYLTSCLKQLFKNWMISGTTKTIKSLHLAVRNLPLTFHGSINPRAVYHSLLNSMAFPLLNNA